MTSGTFVGIIILAIIIAPLAIGAGVGAAHVQKDINGINNDTAACHLLWRCD